ncbi:hypothetical protein [Kaistella faecalis]|uniref:hypothetical protein n=1 Tax=Kaistella faecalis TaxID=2852098 RepID=UPI001C470BF2|nr:hypothetical protein [Chryseobacterium faecale]UFK98151.1 hypothetical protein LL667_02050 [Chryseobacterium faecale]
MIKHTLFYALVFLFIQSCQKETVNPKENSIVNASVDHQEKLSDSVSAKKPSGLEKFPMPSEVEGCSCYFAKNKEDYENEKYIYVDDYGKNAFIKTEGKMIKIPMQEGDLDPVNFEKNIENSDFKITLSGKKINEMDETLMFQGEMAVENKKNGNQYSTPFYGECGC